MGTDQDESQGGLQTPVVLAGHQAAGASRELSDDSSSGQ